MTRIEYLRCEAETLVAWRQVARRVLAGDYEHADKSTKEAITIGLRSLADADCRAAVKRLEKI